MINCPNCRHEEMLGAIYCSECGAQLVNPSIAIQEMDLAAAQAAKPFPGNIPISIPEPFLPISSQRHEISLNIINSGHVLPLEGRSEFTLGRSAEGQSIIPDVDLSSKNAFASGVSRLHAVIKTNLEKVTLMDLGSSNGTFLHGKRLMPNVETMLADRDVFILGELKIQVLID